MAQAFTSDLAEVLLATKLNQYEDALRELGCAFPEDLCDVEEADLQKRLAEGRSPGRGRGCEVVEG